MIPKDQIPAWKAYQAHYGKGNRSQADFTNHYHGTCKDVREWAARELTEAEGIREKFIPYFDLQRYADDCEKENILFIYGDGVVHVFSR